MSSPWESIGATVTFGTTSLSAKIEDIKLPGISTAVYDVSHQGTSGLVDKLFSALSEYSNMEMTIQYDPSFDLHTHCGVSQSVTVTAGGSTLTWTGGIDSFEPQGAFRAIAKANISIMVDGDVTTT